jgi:hypothetical protein
VRLPSLLVPEYLQRVIVGILTAALLFAAAAFGDGLCWARGLFVHGAYHLPVQLLLNTL